ncbi:MAG: amino acid ABC transporter ATP-binding protein [Alteromonadaceae bacterium]|nr:amino acid ABC transporter ATP-binding protein [Alteromonadaceae bacterium]
MEKVMQIQNDNQPRQAKNQETSLAIKVESISKAFGDVPVLKDISFRVNKGEVVCLVGPSGSGKSTVLRCINNLEPVQFGNIFVFGNRIGYYEMPDGRLRRSSEREAARSRKSVGMVFQSFNLFPHMTALENVVEAPIQVLKVPKDEAHRVGLDLLDRVGLSDRSDYYPSNLSGGQQQRVAIARAMAMKPQVMLFDEPTSALDPELVGEVLAVIEDLAAEGMTMMIVTHEMNFAADIADTMIFMDAGHIIEQGSPSEVIENPKSERAKEFFRRVQGR